MKIAADPGIFILAVEDDPIYAETLAMILAELGYSRFTIVDNATDAIRIFKDEHPDILLADIDINGSINGIGLASIVSAIRKIPIVFITAFTDQQTFQEAKSTRPAAYIVKPYHATNLQAAIELALQYEAGKQVDQNRSAANDDDVYLLSDVLFIKYNSRMFKIRIADILYIEVDEKYCHIATSTKRYAVNMRLKNLVDQLPPSTFQQIHRSCAVRIDAIDEINVEEGLIKIAGKELPIGKTFRDSFFTKLKVL